MRNKKMLNEEIKKIKSMMKKLNESFGDYNEMWDVSNTMEDEYIDEKYSSEELVGKAFDSLDWSNVNLSSNSSDKFEIQVTHKEMTDDDRPYVMKLIFGHEYDNDEDGRTSMFFWDVEIDGHSVVDELSDELSDKIYRAIKEFENEIE